MKLKHLKEYIRFMLIAPVKFLKIIESSADIIKKKSRLNYKGWDDDWSFCVFMALFIVFICFSLYYWVSLRITR